MSDRFPSGVLVTCVVPWDERERLLEDRFRAEIRRLLSHGFSHLYIFGTAGEGHAVDTGRFRDVATVFREETETPGILPQVGIIALSTAAAIERIGIAYDLGFRIFQITLPPWGAVSDAELMVFFRDVCGAFPDCRFLHYNVSRAGRLLTASDYRRLAAEIPNLAGTKITGTDTALAGSLMREVPELQHFFVRLFPYAIRLGPCSLLAYWGPMCPGRAQQLYRYGAAGEWEKLDRLAADFEEMDRRVLAPARPYVRMDGAWDKLRVRLGGVRDFPLRLLSPYETIPEEAAAECQRIMEAEYPEWIG